MSVSLNTNFPNGFANGVTIRGMPLLMAYPGKVFWVDSVNGGNGNKGTFDRPFGSIDYAVGMCTANRGDIIVAKPGHVETVTAAGGLSLDVAGICVIGMGRGGLRPKVNFTTAVGADMNVDAANITVMNLLFTGGIDALTGPIDVNAADFTLQDCEYRDVTGEATRVILADANATRLTIDGYWHNGAAAAGGTSAIDLIGVTNPTIKNFKIVGNFSASAIEIRTTACTDVDISDGYVWTKNAADLCLKDTITGSTGKVGPYLNLMLTDNAANVTEALTGATFLYFQPINVVNLAGESSMQTNITASTDA